MARLPSSRCMLASLALLVGVAPLAETGCGGAKPPPAEPRARGAEAVPKRAASFGVAEIDTTLRATWAREKIVPSPRADDATFLRRAYIDIVGTIPPAETTNAFLADTAPDKRRKLVDALLASPEYIEHWTSYWDDVLMGQQVRGALVDRVAFRHWLRSRFAAGSPWDRIVRDLVDATGQNSTGGPRIKGPAAAVEAAMGGPVTVDAVPTDTNDGTKDDDLGSLNGAVNWTLRFADAPQDLAGSASRVFLGVQIQCAQCHDHKTESWKQTDFQKFANAFLHARPEPIDRGQTKGAVRRVDLVDVPGVPPRFTKNADVAPIAKSKPIALDGTDLDKGAGTRKALAAWMTSRDNPWFAKALVNRMWGHFLGRGFVDPVDDMRPSNPGVMPELLDRIAADFVAHDYDLKHLVRTICATEAYQLAASSAAKTDAENKLWGRFHLVPLGPEELLNALLRATDVEAAAGRARIANLDQIRANLVRQYAFLFDVDEEADAPDYSGTVSQALVLLNGALVAQGSRVLPGSMLDELVAKPGSDEEKVEALSVRVLARKPTPSEREAWVAYVRGVGATPSGASAPSSPGSSSAAALGAKGARKGGGGPLERLANRRASSDPKRGAYEDLLWALLNSSEFVFNH